jgi:hypothetical protein
MKTMQQAVTVALVGTLGLLAVTSSFAPTQMPAEGHGLISQYCAPPDEAALHRVYCRYGQGEGQSSTHTTGSLQWWLVTLSTKSASIHVGSGGTGESRTNAHN